MKPIDALTALPRSPEIARVVATAGRQGEAQAQSQIMSFAREMSQRNQIVNQATKTVTDNRTDSDSPGGGGGGYESAAGNKDGEAEKDSGGTQHPSKGKLLDIKGA